MARNLFTQLAKAVNNFRKNYLRGNKSLEAQLEAPVSTFSRALIGPLTNNIAALVDNQDRLFGRISSKINAALTADSTFEGFIIEGLDPQSGFDQNSFYRAVGIATSGAINLSNPANNLPAIGLLVGGNVLEPLVLVKGVARYNAWNWTPMGDIYLEADSADDGSLTQAPNEAEPTYIVQKVGRAITADIAYFDFGLDYTVNP